MPCSLFKLWKGSEVFFFFLTSELKLGDTQCLIYWKKKKEYIVVLAICTYCVFCTQLLVVLCFSTHPGILMFLFQMIEMDCSKELNVFSEDGDTPPDLIEDLPPPPPRGGLFSRLFRRQVSQPIRASKVLWHVL